MICGGPFAQQASGQVVHGEGKAPDPCEHLRLVLAKPHELREQIVGGSSLAGEQEEIGLGDTLGQGGRLALGSRVQGRDDWTKGPPLCVEEHEREPLGAD